MVNLERPQSVSCTALHNLQAHVQHTEHTQGPRSDCPWIHPPHIPRAGRLPYLCPAVAGWQIPRFIVDHHRLPNPFAMFKHIKLISQNTCLPVVNIDLCAACVTHSIAPAALCSRWAVVNCLEGWIFPSSHGDGNSPCRRHVAFPIISCELIAARRNRSPEGERDDACDQTRGWDSFTNKYFRHPSVRFHQQQVQLFFASLSEIVLARFLRSCECGELHPFWPRISKPTTDRLMASKKKKPRKKVEIGRETGETAHTHNINFQFTSSLKLYLSALIDRRSVFSCGSLPKYYLLACAFESSCLP